MARGGDWNGARGHGASRVAANPLADGEGALNLPARPQRWLHRARCLTTSLALGALALISSNARAQVAPARGDSAARAHVDSLSADSLAARLARAEAAIELLRQQLATEAQSAVHTRSRLQFELTGRILTNAFVTIGRSNNVDVPLAALPPSNVAEKNALGVTARQSRIGGAVTVSDVLGGAFIGDLDVDFFGGVQNGPGDRRLFPEPRLRTTRARLRWSRTEIMVGLDDPLISQLNPVSVAASGVPEFSGTGNLWNWLGQLRLTQDVGATKIANTTVRWSAQGAVLAPYAGVQSPSEPDAEDAGERSVRPALEARVQAQWGDSTRLIGTDASIGDGGGEIGIGVHRGWVATGDGGLESSNALAMDLRISLLPRLELRGEAYSGQLLRGLGGGAIGQAFGKPLVAGALGPPLRDQAGWAQLNAQLVTTLIGGAGCGVDVVNGADRPTRTRNTVCAAHLLWRPAEPIVIGFEFRGVSTKYDTGETGRVSHLNLGLGFEL